MCQNLLGDLGLLLVGLGENGIGLWWFRWVEKVIWSLGLTIGFLRKMGIRLNGAGIKGLV